MTGILTCGIEDQTNTLSAFALKYSHDDSTHLQQVLNFYGERLFTGSPVNSDEITNVFYEPIVARYLRIIPEQSEPVGIKWEVIGCEHSKFEHTLQCYGNNEDKALIRCVAAFIASCAFATQKTARVRRPL